MMAIFLGFSALSRSLSARAASTASLTIRWIAVSSRTVADICSSHLLSPPGRRRTTQPRRSGWSYANVRILWDHPVHVNAGDGLEEPSSDGEQDADHDDLRSRGSPPAGHALLPGHGRV